MSTIKEFRDKVYSESGARRVLFQIPVYRARQAKHLEQIVADQGVASKHAVPVLRALSHLPELERTAISIIGLKNAERILTKAEERLARR